MAEKNNNKFAKDNYNKFYKKKNKEQFYKKKNNHKIKQLALVNV